MGGDHGRHCLIAADLAMYQAKRTGRDRYAVHAAHLLGVYRPALAPPARHAAVHHVQHLARAVAAQQAAAGAARWPELQITATGRCGSMPSGSPWMS